MNSDQVYRIVQYVCAKNTQQGYVSPEDFYRVINQAQDEYLDYLRGEYQKYQVGRPIPVVAIGQNERVRESLAPLIYGTILSPNAQGVASFPGDFEFTDAMWSVYNFYRIRFVTQDTLHSYYRSLIDPITVEGNRIYLIKHEGFQFYPETGQARLSYVRTPPSIVWGYVLDSNGIPVYNPATSQDPVWTNTDMMNIISRALRMIGVSMNAQQVSEYANQISIGGQ